mmetsp:Transcript_19234/g.49996  ORF Transcript_19234/g.49996 Transcript_19234/m.49996 type:complete len:115 (-) Transcript_19234:1786-2130(-)
MLRPDIDVVFSRNGTLTASVDGERAAPAATPVIDDRLGRMMLTVARVRAASDNMTGEAASTPVDTAASETGHDDPSTAAELAAGITLPSTAVREMPASVAATTKAFGSYIATGA